MDQCTAEGDGLIISYMVLRRAVGWIGTLLPVVLVVGNALFYTSQPDSMSGYYYTHMRNIFVGTLCAQGVFLWAYRGHSDADNRITNVAGVASILVALFPTKPAVPHLSTSQEVVGTLHLIFAAVTFIALAWMAWRFAGADGEPRHYRRENRVYRASSIMILTCIALVPVSDQLPASVKAQVPFVLILESIAVFAFGVSWFVKGQAIQATLAWIRRSAPPTGPDAAPGPDGPQVTEPSGAML
jgi:hypothetical protein